MIERNEKRHPKKENNLKDSTGEKVTVREKMEKSRRTRVNQQKIATKRYQNVAKKIYG